MTLILLGIIALGIVLDQATKLLVVHTMELWQSIPLIPNIFHFTYIQNKGAAFGSMADQRWLFMIVSTVSIVAISIYVFVFGHKNSKLLNIALAMIVSGGIGNMIDRVRLGYVIDFFDFCAFPFWTWIFNIADIMVVIGCGLVFLSVILDTAKESKAKKAKNAEETHAENNA